MLNANDLEQLKAKGISEKQIEEQLACFVKGFPFLEIAASASVEKGIMVISKEEQASYMDAWDAYLAKNKKIVKFVPASGAASRMFKNLYEFLSADYKEPMNAFEKKFFSEIEKFAFYKALDKKCVENTGKDIPALVALGKYKEVVSNLLEPKGLNYGQLPKGLLLFHKYADTVRTAMEEHLAEGAMYAKNNAGEVNIHFTVSPEHQALFEQLVADKSGEYEEKFSVKYDVSFSIQKPSTDTVAAAMDNTPFRDKNDKLLFRPGGHGALIENLNDVDADVVFIKNIDNVVPDSFKCSTVIYKKVIAGVLDEVILPDDLDSEDYPSFSTMLRWLQWFRENLQRMEGYLRTAGYQILNLGEGFLFSSDSLLDKIRNRYQNWLEQLLRLIYNSGGFLVPVRW